MNLKGIILMIAAMLLIFTPYSFAQKDKKAKEILDTASDRFDKAGGISVYFTLNIKDKKAKVTESFDGNILIEDNKLFLSTPDADTWFDGETQWVYLKGPQEVNISEPSDRDIQMMNPASIFTIYKTGSDYKYNGEKTDLKKRPVYEVEIIPQNKKGDIKKIIVQFNKTDYMPVYFFIQLKNDMENIVHVNKYSTNEKFTSTTFKFDKKKYPKAEIIDLR